MCKITLLITFITLTNIYKFSEVDDEIFIDNNLGFGFEDEEDLYNNDINEIKIEKEENYQNLSENQPQNENIENIIIPDNEEDITKRKYRIPEDELKNDSTKDQMGNVQNQIEFIKDFACYLSVQKVLRNHETAFKKMSGNMNVKLALKKAVANIYITCKQNISFEEQTKILGAKTAEDYESMELEMFRDFDVMKYLEDPDPKLTNVENMMYENYEKLEEEVAKMKNDFGKKVEKKKANEKKNLNQDNKKKSTKRKNSRNKNDSGKKKESKKGNNKKDYVPNPYAMNIFGFSFNDVNPIFVLIPVLFLLCLPILYVWKNLFPNEISQAELNRIKKKNKKLKNKKKFN